MQKGVLGLNGMIGCFGRSILHFTSTVLTVPYVIPSPLSSVRRNDRTRSRFQRRRPRNDRNLRRKLRPIPHPHPLDERYQVVDRRCGSLSDSLRRLRAVDRQGDVLWDEDFHRAAEEPEDVRSPSGCQHRRHR
jgi:hypothetical protein